MQHHLAITFRKLITNLLSTHILILKNDKLKYKKPKYEKLRYMYPKEK